MQIASVRLEPFVVAFVGLALVAGCSNTSGAGAASQTAGNAGAVNQDSAAATGGTGATDASVGAGGAGGASTADARSVDPAVDGGASGSDAVPLMDGSLGAGGSSDAGVGQIRDASRSGALDAGQSDASRLDASSGKTLDRLQRDFVDLRFGMFLHFGILTFCGAQPGDPCPGTWAQSNLAITNFRPSDRYDPGQWADAAVSAHMKFGVLTTRHHDGFALWPSAAGTFNVKSIPWKAGQGDVVHDYVTAFRSRGLLPGLYYSIWDSTEGIGSGPVTPAQLAYVKAQITELLTNYGPIPILVIDGWSWKTGHRAVAYQEIRELVKSLQPDCLLTDHTHLADPWEVDIVNFEEPAGAFAPASNTYAAEQGMKINDAGGNDWFWAPNIGSLMSVSSIVTAHLDLLEPRFTNFLLNCPPNRDGLLDPTIVTRLAEVGAAWTPNASRAALPAQARLIEHPYTPVSAVATSGVAANAIDGVNDRAVHTFWQTTGALPQSVTMDLGQVRPDVGMLTYLPPYPVATEGTGLVNGDVTSYGILVSTDGAAFTEATAGTWTADGKLKTAVFSPVAARYVRFEARGAMGGSAIATDITIGANR
jgi:alpha-L-fucosidase